ncbi:uncharacterized protein [Amphiura filiformis]|uniref:uncharacterized protein isoform X1 n=1 Tax=Amphiura filiformis TaxID=82378 RepID=UPI003B2157A5
MLPPYEKLIWLWCRASFYILEKRPDPSRGGALRWSLPFADMSLPRSGSTKICTRREDKFEEGDLWFVDEPLTIRHLLDQLLDRTTYCDIGLEASLDYGTN